MLLIDPEKRPIVPAIVLFLGTVLLGHIFNHLLA